MDLPSSNRPDGPWVGTPDLLRSRLVVDPPHRINQPVPVPSVYSDDRGEIHNFLIGKSNNFPGQRINLLYTKAGVKRSGDVHPNTQHDFVFFGKIKVWTLAEDGNTVVKSYGANDYIAITPYTPHMFEFEQDSVLAEWWDNGEFMAWFYEPYRKLVDASFVSKCPGVFSHYVLRQQQEDTMASTLRTFARSKLFWSGIALGLSIGFALGQKFCTP